MKRNSAGLIINNDIDEFNKYKLERTRVVQQKSLESRVNKLETELSEMKQILQEIRKGITEWQS